MLGVVAQTFTPSTEEAGGSLSLRASWFSEFQANQGSIVKISVSKEKQIHSPPKKKSDRKEYGTLLLTLKCEQLSLGLPYEIRALTGPLGEHTHRVPSTGLEMASPG